MAFTREFLREHGVPEENISAIMAERGKILNGYVAQADVEEQIKTAVAKALKENAPPAVTDTDEYKSLAAELAMTKALGSEDFADVKPKFRESVYKMLDHTSGAKPIAEQLPAVREAYEEYFVAKPSADPEPPKPQFGDHTEGGMPTGDKGKSFMDGWGFVPKKG